MAEKRIKITEHDDAGNLVATYVQSANDEGKVRVDTILPEVTKSPWQSLLDVFLPAGYPHSVTDDYLEYQIYDSLQAFSSSIAGLLSSRAVLSSVGVGDSSASPTAALLLSILQESAGRIATILFAHRFGTSLEPECKMYRLLADILNDIAFVLDCLSPAFPKVIRVVVLSFSSVLRALCGVAAGSAKASLSAHFARWGNLGELNAKDSSQETVISLFGMLVGSLVVQWVQSPIATWTTLILLLSIHLETNRRAVRAVTMRTLNRQRATLVYHQLPMGHVPTPEEVAKVEQIFERDGILRDLHWKIIGYCQIGAPAQRVLRTLFSNASPELAVKIYKDSAHMLCFSYPDIPSRQTQCDVLLKPGSTARDLLIAWWQALTVADLVQHSRAEKMDSKHEEYSNHYERTLRESLAVATGMVRKFEGPLQDKGWDLDTGALETTSETCNDDTMGDLHRSLSGNTSAQRNQRSRADTFKSSARTSASGSKNVAAMLLKNDQHPESGMQASTMTHLSSLEQLPATAVDSLAGALGRSDLCSLRLASRCMERQLWSHFAHQYLGHKTITTTMNNVAKARKMLDNRAVIAHVQSLVVQPPTDNYGNRRSSCPSHAKEREGYDGAKSIQDIVLPFIARLPHLTTLQLYHLHPFNDRQELAGSRTAPVIVTPAHKLAKLVISSCDLHSNDIIMLLRAVRETVRDMEIDTVKAIDSSWLSTLNELDHLRLQRLHLSCLMVDTVDSALRRRLGYLLDPDDFDNNTREVHKKVMRANGKIQHYAIHCTDAFMWGEDAVKAGLAVILASPYFRGWAR